MATASANPLASGVTAELYRAAIGPRGQDYYLRQFTRFDANGKAGTSWHWPAYWSTFNWLVYRRMWGWALAYAGALLGLAFLIFGVGKLLFNYSDATALLLFLLLLTVAFVWPGLYANAWFYTHLNEKISAVLRESADVETARVALARQAPDNRRWLALVLANAAVLAIAVGVADVMLGADGQESSLTQMRDARPLDGTQSTPIRPLTPPKPDTPPPPAQAAAPQPAPPAAQPAPPVPVPTPSPVASAPVTTAPPEVASTVPAPPPAAEAPPVRAEPVPPAPVLAPPAPAVQTPRVAAPVRPAARPTPRPTYVWVLQAGAFAEEDNAQKALARVQMLGLDAGAESYDTATGRLTRVRVGPFERRAQADQAAERIRALDLPVLVLRQRP